MKRLLANWKTTSAGLTMVGGAATHLVFAIKTGHSNEETWTVGLGGILAGLGLIFAGDADKSASKSDVAQAVDSGNTTFLKTTTRQ